MKHAHHFKIIYNFISDRKKIYTKTITLNIRIWPTEQFLNCPTSAAKRLKDIIKEIMPFLKSLGAVHKRRHQFFEIF